MSLWKMWAGRAMAAALIVAGGAAHAQTVSETGAFLKAVRDGDFARASQALGTNTPVINTNDPESGETALHIVTRGRNAPWMRYLLEERANPNARDKAGATPLFVAAEQRFADGARLLIAARADVNAANRRGETALIRAVQLRDQTMVRLLIESGADPDLADSVAGYSARDYAERDSRTPQIRRLIEAAKPAPKPGG